MSCVRLRPLLFRIAEQEADPAEAIEVARHLAHCTACKILLARERRLARLLERDLVDLPVDESFAASVMATLPDGPPPRAARVRVLRGLKLAGLGGLLALGAAPGLAPAAFSELEGSALASPALDLDFAGEAVPLVRLAALVTRAVVELGARLPALLPDALVPAALAVAAPLAATLLSAALLAALATGSCLVWIRATTGRAASLAAPPR